MFTSTRVRQALLVVLLVGYYAVDRPTVAVAQDQFCDQICFPWSYCGEGCYDENNQTYSSCWEYSGGNCDENPPCYPSANWVEMYRSQTGRHVEYDFWPNIFGEPICIFYYNVHAYNRCVEGWQQDFCERRKVDFENCHFGLDWGGECDGRECLPGNDCHQ